MKEIYCPICGNPLPESVIRQIISESAGHAGRKKTAKKSASSARNAVKAYQAANANYTPEKRREAAKKAWETKRKKSNP